MFDWAYYIIYILSLRWGEFILYDLSWLYMIIISFVYMLCLIFMIISKGEVEFEYV